jgi:hypothetical protein
MNKWFKLLVAALIVISAAIQAKEIQDGHLAVPIVTIVLQLILLVILGGNEIRQSPQARTLA